MSEPLNSAQRISLPLPEVKFFTAFFFCKIWQKITLLKQESTEYCSVFALEIKGVEGVIYMSSDFHKEYSVEILLNVFGGLPPTLKGWKPQVQEAVTDFTSWSKAFCFSDSSLDPFHVSKLLFNFLRTAALS